VIETDLQLEPNEASDLCRVFSSDVLERHGWDRAFMTVLDEAPAEEALALIVHTAGSGLHDGWEALRVHADAASDAGRTEDAEACARREGAVYVLGSQYGKKSGPLSARRSWIARVQEESLEAMAAGGRARIEIVRLRFGLHRAVNDALAAAAVELISLGPNARHGFIDATITVGAAEEKRWAGQVTSADHPINVEAAEFRPDGRLLVGLRYPVTADGHPLLVEIEGVEALFDDPDAPLRGGRVWWLADAGSEGEPVGFRALDGSGDTYDAVVGNLDSSGSAAVIEDHPEGGAAHSEHRRFSLPLTAGGGPVASEVVHRFDDVRRVEGVALDDEGHAHYVIDEEGQVGLRTLMFE